ncbi:MAG: hypothetical protein EBR82_53030 [Caulobacteraceae bacterium]|nr:hypothetical protein [Caulobacteraceae bacterium]
MLVCKHQEHKQHQQDKLIKLKVKHRQNNKHQNQGQCYLMLKTNIKKDYKKSWIGHTKQD